MVWEERWMEKAIRMTVLNCERTRTFRLLVGGRPTGRVEQHSTAKHYSSKETKL